MTFQPARRVVAGPPVREAVANTEASKAASDLHEHIETLADTQLTPCVVREPIIDGICRQGDLVTLGARPGTGKTPLLSQACIAAAAGQPFLGRPTRECRVGLIDLESDPASQRERINGLIDALGYDGDAVRRNLDVFSRGNRNDANSREIDRVLNLGEIAERLSWLENLIAERDYGLVVVDTVLDFAPIKSSDERAVRKVMAQLRSLSSAPPYPVIVGALHLRKRDRQGPIPSLADDPYGWTEEILGSIVWSASADVRLGLESYDDEDRKVFGGFRRGFGEIPPALIAPRLEERDGGPVPVSFELAPSELWRTLALKDAQSKALAKLPVGEWLGWQAILDCGIAKSTASRMVRAALSAGLLEQDDSTKLYRRKS